MARSDYIQHVVRPGSWSPAGFLTAVVVILVDMYLVSQQGPNRDRTIRFTANPAKSRRIVASLYLVAAILSAFVVMSYQELYFVDVGKLGLRNRRDMPQSIYPWIYEEHLDRMPQMFQMMHLRSWAGEAATSKPEWGYFIWFSQQYLSGLIGFTFFLLTQSHVRQLRLVTMLAFVWVAMTSLSCAHGLLLMFTILTPPLISSKWYNIEVLHVVVGILSLAHHVATGMMMMVINTPLFQRQLLITTIIPLILPLLSWILPNVDNHHRRLVSISEAQSKVFLTTGWLSLALYATTAWFMVYGMAYVKPENLSYKLFLNRSDVEDCFRRGFVDFLKHDPSVAAMYCDVMLTQFFLLTWIIASAVSFWGMIKCSLNPWLQTGQRTVWDNRLDLGAALSGRKAIVGGYLIRTEPPFWKMVLAGAFWVIGGLGWAVSIVLGAGTRDLDP